MKHLISAVTLFLIITVGLAFAKEQHKAQPETSRPAAIEDGISVWFSPDGGCTDAIVKQINSAKKSISVLAYRLTSKPIVTALVVAKDRGVAVTIVLDKAQQSDKYSDATFFHNHGMKVLIDHEHAIAHNKVMLIDDETVITGSFNFSAAAEERNAENLLIIEGKPEIVKAYRQNIERHSRHAKVYRAPQKPFATDRQPAED